MKPIATVVNNNQPGWQNIVETDPNITLPVGTRLYLPEAFAELGSPLGGGFFAGEITIAGERYALIVAPKAEGEKLHLEYKNKNRNVFDRTDSDDDGLANSDKINDDNHPAANFCRSLRIGGYDDWYLPSRDELMRIWMALGPNRANVPELFIKDGAEAFYDSWYWSSTEHASYSNDAWIVNFDHGDPNYDVKNGYDGVRAVRRLKI